MRSKLHGSLVCLIIHTITLNLPGVLSGTTSRLLVMTPAYCAESKSPIMYVVCCNLQLQKLRGSSPMMTCKWLLGEGQS